MKLKTMVQNKYTVDKKAIFSVFSVTLIFYFLNDLVTCTVYNCVKFYGILQHTIV